MNTSRTWPSVCVVVGLMAGTVCALTIETVTVGNPGNAPDTRYSVPPHLLGYGSVGYTYEIGKYEVTAGQYTEFLIAVAKTDIYGLYHPAMAYNDTFGAGSSIQQSGSPGDYTYSVPPDWANRPVNRVSWVTGLRFANWMHNGQPTGEQNASTTEDGSYDLSILVDHPPFPDITRKAGAKWVIPSEDEWYKAAYHKNDGVTGNYWDYPTGTDTLPSNDLIDPDPGNNANFLLDDPTIGQPYNRTVVGEFENSASPYGTFDQGGNVEEMTERRGGGRGGYLFRGGAYGSGRIGAADSREFHYPYLGGFFTGLRLVHLPEPGTLVLLAFGGVGLLARRRR